MAAEGLNNALDITAGVLPTVGTLIGGPLVGAAATGLATGLRAFSQWNRSKNTKVPSRPISMTPQGIIENQQNARQVASGSLADATNTLANQQLQQSQAQGIGAAKQSARSSTDIMATLGRLNQNTNNSLNNLAQQRYGQRLGGYNMLNQANQNIAGYDDRNFAYNQVEPYNQAVQNKQNLLTASNTNFDRAGQFIGQNALGMEYLKSANPDYKPQQGGLLGMYSNYRDRRNQPVGGGIYGNKFLSNYNNSSPSYDDYNTPNT
jgi:hypothetical protein